MWEELGGGRVDVTKDLKVLTQEGWGKGGYQTPGGSPARTNSSGYRIKRDRGRKTWKTRVR